MGGGDAGHPSADHHDAERLVGIDVVLVPTGRPEVRRERQFLADHREVLVHLQPAGHELEDLLELAVRT